VAEPLEALGAFIIIILLFSYPNLEQILSSSFWSGEYPFLKKNPTVTKKTHVSLIKK
jgi:hypothetical protein